MASRLIACSPVCARVCMRERVRACGHMCKGRGSTHMVLPRC